MAQKELDCKGKLCPLPIIDLSRFSKNEMQVGDVVRMEATDKACKSDVEAWCKKTGNQLIDSTLEGDISIMFIQRTV
jgi:TusA-related sulfurtransferase